MARCCSGASCSCKMVAGEHMLITGTGSTNDPFILTSDVVLTVLDNTVFNLVLSGSGTVASPWVLEVHYASTATLNDIPDVDAVAPANGEVLAWNDSTQRWEPAAPTTAASGSVQHDTSLAGDGSAGTPLEVQEDPDRLLTTTASGLGLSDDGINQTVRRFADSTARDAADPPPDLNTISVLNTAPGQYDYWDGLAWQPIEDYSPVTADAGTALLELSGPYDGSSPITQHTKMVSTSTDAGGLYEVLSSTDLAGWAGVLTVQVQEVGALAWKTVVFGDTDKIMGTAYRLSDGSEYAGQAVDATVVVWLY